MGTSARFLSERSGTTSTDANTPKLTSARRPASSSVDSKRSPAIFKPKVRRTTPSGRSSSPSKCDRPHLAGNAGLDLKGHVGNARSEIDHGTRGDLGVGVPHVGEQSGYSLGRRIEKWLFEDVSLFDIDPLPAPEGRSSPFAPRAPRATPSGRAPAPLRESEISMSTNFPSCLTRPARTSAP